MSYLEIKDLSVTYRQGQIAAVRSCGLSINRGDTLGIVGESGSGKSTLALALLRMLPEKTAQTLGEFNGIVRRIIRDILQERLQFLGAFRRECDRCTGRVPSTGSMWKVRTGRW